LRSAWATWQDHVSRKNYDFTFHDLSPSTNFPKLKVVLEFLLVWLEEQVRFGEFSKRYGTRFSHIVPHLQPKAALGNFYAHFLEKEIKGQRG
jgi:hypothetical protein